VTLADTRYETLLLEQHDRVARITLNRPDVHNAISQTLQSELVDAVERCVDTTSVHAIVLRGAGRSFCSGYDLGSAGRSHGDARSLPGQAMSALKISRDWSRIWNAPLPVIAQIHGHCLAGGTDIAQHCDLIVVAEDATIGFPALRMGGTPPTNMWLYNVGPQWAKRLLFTGDTFTGRFAAHIGFALEAVPNEELDQHVLQLATRIAAMGRDIVAINKHILNKGLDLMGRSVLQEFSAPMDIVANQAFEMGAFVARSREVGLSEAFKERDAPFSDGVPLDYEQEVAARPPTQ
jgi:enoyl-CoA hydratase